MLHNYLNIKEILVKCIVILPLSACMRRLFSFITMVINGNVWYNGNVYLIFPYSITFFITNKTKPILIGQIFTIDSIKFLIFPIVYTRQQIPLTS
jgi:hypothetical protein